MKQRELIELLDSCMPEITRTGKPEPALLKAARTNNLAPAQLEKLAQLFNTMKCNVVLNKSASRGASFSLVNPADLLEEYGTWRAENHTSRTKRASIEKAAKAASLEDWFDQRTDEKGRFKDDVGLVFVDETEDCGNEEFEIGTEMSDSDIRHMAKAASAEIKMSPKERKQFFAKVAATAAELEDVKFNIREDIREELEGLQSRLTPDEGRWAEAVEDLALQYGVEKAATVINMVEDHFIAHKHRFTPADLTKSAFSDRPFAQDRHNVFPTAEALFELLELQKEAQRIELPYDPTDEEEDNVDRKDVPHTDVDGKPDMPGGADAETNDTADRDDRERSNKRQRHIESDPAAALLEDSAIAASPIGALLEGMKNPYMSRKHTSILQPIDDMKERIKDWKGHGVFQAHAGQDKIDKAKDTAMRETTLNQLMLSDPIIADADPQQVKDLYDTLVSLSPVLATDPNLMGPALKEAIQYGSVPIQTIKDHLSAQKTKLEIDKLNKEIAR